MKASFKTFLLPVVLLACACSKSNDPAPSDLDITGTWALNGRLPLMDSVWRTPVQGDIVVYSFSKTGRVTMHTPNLDETGVYDVKHVADTTAGMYKLTMHFNESVMEMRLEVMPGNQLRFDGWGILCGTGYTSDRFKKQ